MQRDRRNLSQTQTRQKRTRALVTVCAILIIWLTSCTTTAQENNAPRATPPDPYDANGKLVWTYDEKSDSVVVPYWYWEKIFDYIVDAQAAQKINKKDKKE